MSENSSPRALRKRKRFTLPRSDAERRRAAISITVGLIVLLLLRIPAIEQSFLGGPDREMMETAFTLRTDVTAGAANPILFLDFDDRSISRLASASPSFGEPLATMPRGRIADLLQFMLNAPAASAPRVVVLDIDVAQPPPPSDTPDDVTRLKSVLAAWAASKTAPRLIITRETYPAATMGMEVPAQVLPDTIYDGVVQTAPNIFWSTPKVLSDRNGVIREFLPFECTLTRTGIKPLYSAAILAYQAAERDPNVLSGRASVGHFIDDAAARCQDQPKEPLKHGERINYHLSLNFGFSGRVWPALDPTWPGFKQCGRSDSAIFRRLSAIDILDAVSSGDEVNRGILCQRVVIIGGTNASGGDFVQTPLHEMNGSVVLANAIRGLELSHGGLRPIPLAFQVLLLIVISALISSMALATQQTRRSYRLLRASHHKDSLAHKLRIISLNPVILNGIIAIGAHCLGIGLMLISLNFGFWGFVSAPAFAAAIAETVQEFADG